MKTTIKVYFLYDENKPEDTFHIGIRRNMTKQSHKIFPNNQEGQNKAIQFWYECSHPITTLMEIPSDLISTCEDKEAYLQEYNEIISENLTFNEEFLGNADYAIIDDSEKETY